MTEGWGGLANGHEETHRNRIAEIEAEQARLRRRVEELEREKAQRQIGPDNPKGTDSK